MSEMAETALSGRSSIGTRRETTRSAARIDRIAKCHQFNFNDVHICSRIDG